MEFRIELDPRPLTHKIEINNRILLTGSCFTEHIAEKLRIHKFNILENPNGILFNPVSITQSICSYIESKVYKSEDLFYEQGIWSNWDFHSRFSAVDQHQALEQMNDSITRAHGFLETADWIIITLGSAFVYQLDNGRIVANCHKAPANLFRKKLLTIPEVLASLDTLVHKLFHFNKALKIIFTVSPVRHLRDGLVENNRSKAVLLESVHHITEKFNNLYYFPSYELVIDDLRDYRFYAEDMVHPNYQATQYVWEKFTQACISGNSREVMKEIYKLNASRAHRPLHPGSDIHKNFLRKNLDTARQLQHRFPQLNFEEEIRYFSDENK